MEFREATLPNGLSVVAETNAEARSLAVGFFVKTGARDERDDIAGVSHFLEHMAFKGSARRSADDVNREFDEMGAHYNAFTSEEKTVYYAAVLPEYQAASVDLLADILRPALRDDDFHTEKKVILEEIQMYLDQPPFGADVRVRELHYGRHPLARSVLGTPESIGALPVDAMRSYFHQRYCPGNISLVACGQVDFEALVDQAISACGAWPSVATGRAVETPSPNRGFECILREGATQEYCIAVADAPTATSEDRFSAKLLAVVLGDDTGSRLYWELVEPGLAEHAVLGHYEYDGAGAFITYMSCPPDAAQQNLARIMKVYRTVEQGGITPGELDQAKSKVNSRVVLASERPRGRLFNLGGNWTLRRKYRSIKDDLDAVDRVTVSDIARVAKSFQLTVCTTVAVGPLAKLELPQ